MPPSPPPPSADEAVSEVCQACGLCCEGALYTHVALQDDAEVAFAEGMGLPIVQIGAGRFFLEPCVGFQEGRCSVYENRFERCRAYTCLLIKNLREGHATRADALTLVRDLRRRFDLVRRTLNPDGAPMSVADLVEREIGRLPGGSIAGLPPEHQRAFLELGVLATLLTRHIDPRRQGLS